MRSDVNGAIIGGRQWLGSEHPSKAFFDIPAAVNRNQGKPNVNEEELVAFLRRHKREGIALLYDRYAGSLFGVLFRLLHSREMAEDALQETFVKIWANFDSYDGSRGRLFTWMVNIARNVALDKIKSRDHKNSLKNQEIGGLVSVIEAQTAIGDASDRIGLHEIVQTLKPEQEEVIELIYFQGYTQAEASDKLGIPLGTVKTRVRAAISTIRKFFS
jgi:RNA polymerase sigma-70 factor (ECF subfamily)